MGSWLKAMSQGYDLASHKKSIEPAQWDAAECVERIFAGLRALGPYEVCFFTSGRRSIATLQRLGHHSGDDQQVGEVDVLVSGDGSAQHLGLLRRTAAMVEAHVAQERAALVAGT